MKTRLLHEHAGLRTYAVIFDEGDQPLEGLKRFAGEERMRGAQLSAIGAFSTLTVGYFDWPSRDYQRIRIDEQVEVLALTGNIARQDDEPALHLHVVVGRADGRAYGGHLLEATVRPTLEVVVTEVPQYLRRRLDPATGLALIDASA
jgi:predicted DNA-binding protein with PD1-like motif